MENHRKREIPLLACALSGESTKVAWLQETLWIKVLWLKVSGNGLRVFVQVNPVFICRNTSLFGHEDGFLPKDEVLFLKKVLSRP